MSKYKYEHFQNDRSIRLLNLLPWSDPTDPIRCQLQVYSLTEGGQVPQYTALSYVWGDPNPVRHIECESGILQITENCFQALRSIRDWLGDSHQDQSFSPLLWIDAICINQSDKQEKGAQIQLMKDIYYLAETVLCFMEDSNAYEGLNGSKRLGKTSTSRRQRISHNHRDSFNWMIGRNISSGDAKQRELALQRLSRSKYWTRLWTFQEALLSSRKIIFSGTDMIEWESVGSLLKEATSLKYSGFHQSLPNAIVFYTLTTTSPMLHFYLGGKRAIVAEKFDQTFIQSLSLEISRILSFCSELETTDPRDKVYSLVGLMAALDINLKIDYTRPVALIYTESISAFSKSRWSFSSGVTKPKVISYAVLIDSAASSRSTSTNLGRETHHFSQKKKHWFEEDTFNTSTRASPSPSLTGVDNVNSYASLVHSHTNALLINRKKWLKSLVLFQLGSNINQCSPDEGGSRNQRVSSNTVERSKHEEKFTKGQTRIPRSTRKDRGDQSDDEGDQERPRKKTKGSETIDLESLLACPFYQRNPSRPSVHRSCAGPGWSSISRLKEHLYRTHFAHRCRRCRMRFENASELEDHYQDPIPCPVSTVTIDPMEGFCESQRESIKSRRMRDWRQIYQILFPDDDERYIPSENYSSVIAIAEIIDQFDRHYQQEAERLLPGHLWPLLEGSSTRSESEIQSNVLQVINNIHSTVIQSFRQRMAGMVVDNTAPMPHQNSSAPTPPRIEPNLDNPASYFLEYLSNVTGDESFLQLLDSNPDFELGDVHSSDVNEQTARQEYSPRPESSSESSDEGLNIPIMVETPESRNTVTEEQVLNLSENETSGWNDDWTFLSNVSETDTSSNLTTRRRDLEKDDIKRNIFEGR